MKKHTRMLLTVPAALLIILCALVIMNPMGAGVAAQRVTGQQQGHHTPHYLLKPNVRHKLQPQLAGSNLNYGGGPVMAGTTHVFAIFWEPGNNVASGYNNLISQYFGDIGGSPLYAITNQYTQTGGAFPSNAVLSGSFVDPGAYPESPLLDSDIQNEVSHAQQVNGWQSSINNIFFVFTGRNQNICFDSTQSQCASNTFCAYHNFFGSNTIYATMPYAASFSCNPGSSPNNNDADQTINVSSHEQIEAATDPLLNAWTDSSGQEIGDKCNFMFGPLDAQGGDVNFNNHEYILQEEWDNNTSSCRLTPSTTPPPTPTPTNTPPPTPTPTNTPTPTPTNTPTPPPTGNLVVNPGFENGTAPWQESSANGAELIDPTNPHTGSFSAFLCGYDFCNDQIRQNITLPGSFTTATFSYWTFIDTNETTTSTCFDKFTAKLRTSSGTTIATVQSQCNFNAHGWTQFTFTVTSQLSSFKGQTIQIFFQGTTDSSLSTDFFVDDVSLSVS